MVSFDPTRPDFAPYGLTCVRWRPTPMPRPDRHNEIELNFLETGWVTYLFGGRKIRVEAGRLSAFWAGLPHQIIDFGDQSEYFVVTLPLAWFLQCKLPERLVQALLHGQVVSDCEADRIHSDQQLFAGWVKDLRKPTSELKKAVLLELEARLLRLGIDTDHANERRRLKRKPRVLISDGGLNKVEQMACLIAQRYAERLTVEAIGRAVDLHPNYAMSLFKTAFGTTLINYLTEHRVSHAQRLLVTTEQKIVHVALDSGFGSINRFNEAFRKICGCTPRQYRRLHQ